MDIEHIIREIKGKLDRAGGLKAVFFVACGGSQAAIYPGKYLLDAEARNISVKIYNSNEFVHVTPKALDNRCLVICCSLKATAETVEAVKAANKAGAVTIAMTGGSDTGMADVGQYVVTYSNGDNQIYSQGNQAQVLRICFEILHQFEGYGNYEAAMKGFDAIDELIDNGKTSLLPAAKRFAEEFKEDEVFYVLGSGALSGTAYTMVNCHFIEMQCLHAVMVHSGEYFHGPFETTDKDLAMVLLMGTGRSRFLDERVLNFLQNYAKRYIIIDAADIGIEEKIDPSIAEYFNSIIMIPIERFYVSQLAEVREHSMDSRRYMWKVDY